MIVQMIGLPKAKKTVQKVLIEHSINQMCKNKQTKPKEAVQKRVQEGEEGSSQLAN